MCGMRGCFCHRHSLSFRRRVSELDVFWQVFRKLEELRINQTTCPQSNTLVGDLRKSAWCFSSSCLHITVTACSLKHEPQFVKWVACSRILDLSFIFKSPCSLLVCITSVFGLITSWAYLSIPLRKHEYCFLFKSTTVHKNAFNETVDRLCLLNENW